MNPNWRQYGKEMLRYAWFLPLAPVVALIPFLFNLDYWQERVGLWVGLGLSLLFGTVIGLVINLFFIIFYAVLTWIRIRTGKFYQPPIFAQILLGSFGAMTGMWAMAAIKSWWQGSPAENPPFLPTFIFSGVIATAIALYFAYRRAREESLALRAESAEARYQTLENQMRPHFLFNALNSLAELIESGQERAAETAYKLSDLYRQILANSGLKTASLSSELKIVRAYLELEQLRFDSRLRFRIEAPDDSDRIFLPSLMLQTLVENAVKHGIAPSLEGGDVEVSIVRNAGQLYHLSVANTGNRYQPQASANSLHTSNGTGNGVGLINTRARLDLLYGNRHGFQIRSDTQGRTVASFNFTGEKID